MDSNPTKNPKPVAPFFTYAQAFVHCYPRNFICVTFFWAGDFSQMGDGKTSHLMRRCLHILGPIQCFHLPEPESNS